jgi:hypothetical protein
MAGLALIGVPAAFAASAPAAGKQRKAFYRRTPRG